MDGEVNIRQATALDASDIARLVIEMHGDAHPLVGAVTTEMVNTGFLAVAYSISLGHAYVATVDDRIVGTIGALLESDWWTREPFLADKWWYVCPEHRGKGAGMALMRALCARADELQLPFRSYWIGTVEKGAVLERFMRRCGFRQVGCIFTRGA